MSSSSSWRNQRKPLPRQIQTKTQKTQQEQQQLQLFAKSASRTRQSTNAQLVPCAPVAFNASKLTNSARLVRARGPAPSSSLFLSSTIICSSLVLLILLFLINILDPFRFSSLGRLVDFFFLSFFPIKSLLLLDSNFQCITGPLNMSSINF